MNTDIETRLATKEDLQSILQIYNQGIEDRVATLEEDQKGLDYMEDWFSQHNERFAVVVAVQNNEVVGWASLNRYSNRCAYNGVTDLSIYIKREYRGRGIGSILLSNIERIAMKNNFNKIVLFTLPFNKLGQGLYRDTTHD
ncbi:GNAT family N-acetyltransferase [Bacillus canaveralius]|uniref:GNAT family N-acetyltransferase n=1 Tax=Bacillus canaveralius TaxID=1403243 RepID=A0A2N5GGH6_9BACI|nr:GNAT family N-acetyltransferase [Bacillus canaveralius]PLR79868.1 GNAT family N-acetyltransferase [Bacillus canaveralius]PLR96043.1 GNAT family N-acetyltransferase [Bacillus canaveralius]RSK51592.1 N-acetyltransferase [Bacillus canaveralius]